VPAAPPPPSADWWLYVKSNFGLLGFLISAVLAIFKFYEFRNSRRDRSRDQLSKVNDAWFKTIVLDGAIPHIRSFLDSQRSALSQASNVHPRPARPHQSVLLSYIPASEELKIRLIPVEELSTNAYATIVRNIEKLDDAVSPYCSHADDASVAAKAKQDEWLLVQQSFDQCFRESLRLLRQVHFELSRGEDPDKTIPPPAD
jgi:hypothetical protein